MLSQEKFLNIRNITISSIHETLNHLYLNCSEDYVLFLAGGEYDELIANSKNCIKEKISPYCIDGFWMDSYNDGTRLQFLCEFLNRYYNFNDNQLEDNIYRINIEFLIYTHIWESNPFLKQFYRVVHLYTGHEYEWNLKLKSFGKSNFIEKNLISLSKKTPIAFVNEYYNRDLRNSIAHSDYHLDAKDKKIGYYPNNSRVTRVISFDEWNLYFVHSCLFSYYLTKIISERRKDIINAWGRNYFTIKMPFSDGTIRHAVLEYDVTNDAFNFVQKT